jgi:hypothetical protein
MPSRSASETKIKKTIPLEVQTDGPSLPRINNDVSTAEILNAKNIDASKAEKLIAGALMAIVNAKSYSMR